MKCRLGRSQLVSLLSVAQRVVPTKPLIPILGQLLIEAKDQSITFTATDLHLSIRASMAAEVEVEGSIAIPARRFFQLVRELSTSTLDLTVEHQSLSISAGPSSFKIPGMSREEFPEVAAEILGVSILMKSEELQEMLMRTSFSAARDDQNKPACVSVCMSVKEGLMTLLATDAKRLARYQKPVDLNGSLEAVIPLKAVNEMIDLLNFDETATLSFAEGKVLLRCGPISLVSKLIGLPYPEMNPSFFDRSKVEWVILSKEEWLSLLRQISLFTSDTNHSARFIFGDQKMRIEAKSLEYGEGIVETWTHSELSMELSFNPHFLMEALKHMKGSEVHLGVKDPYLPAFLIDPETDRLEFIIMPMRKVHA